LTQGSAAPNSLLSAKGINYAPNTAHGQVKAICHLDGVWRSLACTTGVLAGTIAADELWSLVLRKPRAQRRSRAVRQEVHNLTGGHVDYHRTVAATPILSGRTLQEGRAEGEAAELSDAGARARRSDGRRRGPGMGSAPQQVPGWVAWRGPGSRPLGWRAPGRGRPAEPGGGGSGAGEGERDEQEAAAQAGARPDQYSSSCARV
jgi:hypothetical protein